MRDDADLFYPGVHDLGDVEVGRSLDALPQVLRDSILVQMLLQVYRDALKEFILPYVTRQHAKDCWPEDIAVSPRAEEHYVLSLKTRGMDAHQTRPWNTTERRRSAE